MDTLSEVEQKNAFTFPRAYRSFFERGFLTYPGDAYLWVHEAEWLKPAEMLDNGGFFGDPKPGLLAFAFTGGRDLWAWQTRSVTAYGEPPIALCPRDCHTGEWYAPSFLGWLYRTSLEYAAALWAPEEEAKEALRRWANLLEAHGERGWSEEVGAIASRQVMIVRSGNRGQHVDESLIGIEDVHDRIVAAFGTDFVDAPYVWSVDG